jgi:hypothetical protein
MFLRSFFNYMWDYDSSRHITDRRLLYMVLEGDHSEAAIIEVDDSGCPGLSSAIPSESEGAMAFVHHTDATQFLRDQMSAFFVLNSPLTDPATFQATMKQIGDVQLSATLNRLAKGLPLYKVCVVTSARSVFSMLLCGCVHALHPSSRTIRAALDAAVAECIGCVCVPCCMSVPQHASCAHHFTLNTPRSHGHIPLACWCSCPSPAGSSRTFRRWRVRWSYPCCAGS